ncbi:MAG: hypothetical protein AAB318_06095, partial [Planctomycetota bacterium]
EQDGVKDSVINLDVQVLSHVFTIAISEGIIDINPCQKVKRLKISQVNDRILSGDEIAAIQALNNQVVAAGRNIGQAVGQ